MELPRAAGHAFGQCRPMFREGRPFLQKVVSETPPGGHFDDFEAILMPFGDRLGHFLAHFRDHFACAFFQAKNKRFLVSRWRFGAGLAGGGDSFQDIPGADVLEGKFHTPSVRLLAWRGVPRDIVVQTSVFHFVCFYSG